MRSLILLAVLFLTFEAGAVAFCHSQMAERSKCKIMLGIVHPTQMTVGNRDANLKTDKLLGFTQEQLEDYLPAKPLDLVIGPGDIFYAVDGHHFALGAVRAGLHWVYGEIVHNFSKLSEEKFWREMRRRRLYYPFKFGEGPIHHEELPTYLEDMTDDPYRSLASAVREGGGFKKSRERFFEYIWAEYFRWRMPDFKSEVNFTDWVARATELARSEDSLGLPGHILAGDKGCAKLLKRNPEMDEFLKKYLN